MCVGITGHAQHPLLGVYRHSHLAIQNLHEQITDQFTPPSAQDRQVRRLVLFLGFDESLKVTARGQQSGGDFGFGSIEGGGPDTDVSTIGLGGEYQFASAPISVFGGYRHSEIDDVDIESDALTIGVRYNFGGSLFDRNRSGASLSRGAGLGRYANVL